MVKKILIILIVAGLISAIGHNLAGNNGFMGMEATLNYIAESDIFNNKTIDLLKESADLFNPENFSQGINRYTNEEESTILSIVKQIGGTLVSANLFYY